MEITHQTQENECCPPFDPAGWDMKELEWTNKRFVKGKVHTFFYMPIDFGRAIRRINASVSKAEAEMPDWLSLSEHISKWRMDIYLAVDREVPDVENVLISGRFLSKVYEGPFSNTSKWVNDFEAFALSKGSEIKKLYMWYTTCPKCAKDYGKNYVVILAEVE